MKRRRTRKNKTVVLFLGNNVDEYNQIISDSSKFIKIVNEAHRVSPFKYHHRGCPRHSRFTDHGHYIRTIKGLNGKYELIIHRVRCLDCGSVYTICPSFAFRYKRQDAELVESQLEKVLIGNGSYRYVEYDMNKKNQ